MIPSQAWPTNCSTTLSLRGSQKFHHHGGTLLQGLQDQRKLLPHGITQERTPSILWRRWLSPWPQCYGCGSSHIIPSWCGSCILPIVESPYSPTFQTSPSSSIHSESTILNPVVWIWKSESKSEQTGPKAPILPSSLVGLFFLIPGYHSTQSRPLCRFPRVSTTLVTLFVSSVVSSWPLHFHFPIFPN